MSLAEIQAARPTFDYDPLYGKKAGDDFVEQIFSSLTAQEAARLAVMLPAPKRFEKNPGSAYLSGRTRTIMARMGSAELP